MWVALKEFACYQTEIGKDGYNLSDDSRTIHLKSTGVVDVIQYICTIVF